MRLKDKIAIITGSSRGIGAATAKLFADEGAQFIVNYKENKTAAEKVFQSLAGKNHLMVQADLTKEDEVRKLVQAVMDKYGRIDILVNNAGAIIRPGDWKASREVWQETIDANLTSCWLMTREVALIMQQQKSGSIVNLTSTVGLLGSARVLAYSAAKNAIVALTKAMAKELAPNIRVNAVAPSNVMTDMTRSASPQVIDFATKNTPLKRIADPEELAQPILFLASDEASYITGHILVVDGGYSLK